MRVLYFSAAITMMHMVHALPRTDLAARDGVNDLLNERHQFHHFDRNQRTANQNRGDLRGDNVAGSGLYFDKGVRKRAEQAERRMTTEEGNVLESRFMRSPDYSEGGTGVGSDSVNAASNSTQTQPPANAESPTPTATGDHGAKPNGHA